MCDREGWQRVALPRTVLVYWLVINHATITDYFLDDRMERETWLELRSYVEPKEQDPKND